jgi:hypothetical protein
VLPHSPLEVPNKYGMTRNRILQRISLLVCDEGEEWRRMAKNGGEVASEDVVLGYYLEPNGDANVKVTTFGIFVITAAHF